MKDDAEATAQGGCDESGACRRSDQSELRQLQLDGARSRALTNHQVELIILHRRIEHLFDGRVEAMYLVYEEHVAFLQVCEERRQVSGLFDDRPCGRTQLSLHLIGDDVGKRGLA